MSVIVPVLVCAGQSEPAHAQGLPYPSYSGYDIKGSGAEAHDTWFIPQILGNYSRGLVTNAFWPRIQPTLQPAPCAAGQSAYDGYCFTNDASLDWLVKSYSDTGARVTLVLVGVPNFASNGCAIAPWCGTSAGGVAHFARFAGYVANRYNGLTPGQGRAVHFVIHNEVNSAWAYYSDGCTSCTVAGQVSRYATDFNAAYDRIKSEQAAAKVLVSLTNYYSGPDNPNPGGGITIPTYLTTFAPQVGGRAWQVALHAYAMSGSSGTSPVFDVTDPQMTPGSMGQLVGWLRRQFPSTPSAWEIHLTEQGLHGDDADNGAVQSQWLCNAFRNVLGTPGIESYLYTPPLTHGGYLPAKQELVKCSTTNPAAPADGNCAPNSPVATRWSWQTWALANRIDVGILNCGFENLPYTKLSRYYNGSRGHLATTRMPPAGSSFEGAWRLFRYPQAATHPLYECEVGSAGVFPLGHTFVDRSYTCAGWLKPMGPLGYAYDSPGAGRQPLYRCYINAPGWGTHFVSNSPTCEGWVVEDLLGYVQPW